MNNPKEHMKPWKVVETPMHDIHDTEYGAFPTFSDAKIRAHRKWEAEQRAHRRRLFRNIVLILAGVVIAIALVMLGLTALGISVAGFFLLGVVIR